MMKYKGYTGYVQFDDEAAENRTNYERHSRKRKPRPKDAASALVQQAFRNSIDDYLDFCAERNEEPDKPFSGKFVVRIPSELHRRASSEYKEQIQVPRARRASDKICHYESEE